MVHCFGLTMSLPEHLGDFLLPKLVDLDYAVLKAIFVIFKNCFLKMLQYCIDTSILYIYNTKCIIKNNFE